MTKELAYKLKTKEVMEGFDPIGDAIKKTSEKLDKDSFTVWGCRHCGHRVVVFEDEDLVDKCSTHMLEYHPNITMYFKHDYRFIGFVDKTKKEND